jgi:hypothetical protein
MDVEPPAPKRRQRTRSQSKPRSSSPKRLTEAKPLGTERRIYKRPDVAISVLLHGTLMRSFFQIPDGIELITFAHMGQRIQFQHVKRVFALLRENADLFESGTLDKLHETLVDVPGVERGRLRIYKSGEQCRNMTLVFQPGEPFLGFYSVRDASFEFSPVFRSTPPRMDRSPASALAEELASLSLQNAAAPGLTHAVKRWPVMVKDAFTGFYLKTAGHLTSMTNSFIAAVLKNDIVDGRVSLSTMLESFQQASATPQQKIRVFLLACMDIRPEDAVAIGADIIED